jgi:DNA-binding transcriptional MerR regulator
MRQRRSTFYSTSDLAREAGLHPNTIRRYVDWGLLPPVERSAAGYRRFTEHHLRCLRLARLVFHPPYPGKTLRASGRAILTHAVADDWGGALAQAYTHLAQVRAELAQAGAAASYLEHWAEGGGGPTSDLALPIRGAAERLGLTVDALRNWERNGLIDVPRDPHNGYRVYGLPELNQLRVIRMLNQAGHSHMAILRMLQQLERGDLTDLRGALELSTADDDARLAADRWATTLRDQEAQAQAILSYVAGVASTTSAAEPSI